MMNTSFVANFATLFFKNYWKLLQVRKQTSRLVEVEWAIPRANDKPTRAPYK